MTCGPHPTAVRRTSSSAPSPARKSQVVAREFRHSSARSACRVVSIQGVADRDHAQRSRVRQAKKELMEANLRSSSPGQRYLEAT